MKQTRRDFVRIAGIGALGLGAATAIPPKALAATLSGDLKIQRRSELMMGTYVTLTVLDRSQDKATKAIQAAIDEMARLEKILTRYDSAAPLAHLARAGSLSSPEPELLAVLQAAAGYHAASSGRFDISIAPIVDATKESFAKTQKPLTGAQLTELMKRVDGSAIKLSAKRIELLKDGMALTLDGLGKGFIVDRAIETLKANGIKQALVNAGGDIRALGAKGKNPWRIGVIDPTKRGGKGPIVGLKDAAIATSGNYEVFYDTEKLHHHIINPGQGVSPKAPVSVSIRSTSCLAADALSTAVFCLSSTEVLPFLAAQKADGMVIHRNGEKMTRGRWS